jgi:hypothetical protein
MMLSMACVFVWEIGIPSVKMWVDRGEVQYCGLSIVGMVEMIRIRQVMWLVMLKSTKDRILAVDTTGQQVLPRVQYGMTSLLIRGAVGSVPYSDEWELA